MFKYYIKLAFRNLIKHKKYSFINVLSLSIGLACFILIMLWVQDELSYDSFHNDIENKYLLLREEDGKKEALSAKPIAKLLKEEFPEIIDATSYAPLPETFKPFIEYEEKGFEENIALIDPCFFNVFNYKFKEGSPKTAMLEPTSVIITEQMKQKYFGEKNAMGESIDCIFLGQKVNLKVTGILENLPTNTHINREFFMSINIIKSFGVDWETWANHSSENFIHLNRRINEEEFCNRILTAEKNNTYVSESNGVKYSLIPIEKIHLYTTDIEFFSTTGDIKYVYIFCIFASIILLIACMNYMNLTNALSLKRMKEIGVKKVVGAKWHDLIIQYLSETLAMTFVSLIIALFLVELFLPVLNRLSGKSLFVDYTSTQFIILVIATLFITANIAGLYPALFISKFKPVKILKGKLQNLSDGINFQTGLLVFQFSLSTIIIICTVIIFSQLNFIKNRDLGYDKENVICIRIKGDIFKSYDSFKNKLKTDPNILSVARSEPLDLESLGKTGGVDWPGKNKDFRTWLIHVDNEFALTYKLEMKEGRFYSDQFLSDETSAYVINEAAEKELGFEQPLGREITVWGKKGKIIGVTKDFNYSSLHNKVESLIMRIPTPEERNNFYRELSVRIKPYTVNASIAYLEDVWKAYFPSEPFNFYFFDEHLNAKYNAEERMGEIFKYFSILSIFIACLGLYGLTAFMIERKIKDIGIHKILGASIGKIVFMLSKKYMVMILLSNFIAFPVTYFFMSRWLQNFVYRVEIQWWAFALSAVITLIIALATVSSQSVKAAKANPVKSLKYE